jgi:hypothetical protein
MEHVEVSLRSATIEGKRSTLTDSDGIYLFDNLVPEVITISVVFDAGTNVRTCSAQAFGTTLLVGTGQTADRRLILVGAGELTFTGGTMPIDFAIRCN